MGFIHWLESYALQLIGPTIGLLGICFAVIRDRKGRIESQKLHEKIQNQHDEIQKLHEKSQKQHEENQKLVKRSYFLCQLDTRKRSSRTTSATSQNWFYVLGRKTSC